ncbi:peptide N-acetyl-beta-D-glucosaminyl asparaginase amidase A-domain-containing protein [Biscogniauxia mediterranea]|nr:peptide N-acetyl-beta-D-glucosaminyl asparaginase amidase A-domain-containing protein [Biscogniauxia mediterranea]
MRHGPLRSPNMAVPNRFLSLLCLFVVPALSSHLIKHQEPSNTTTTTSSAVPTATVVECVQVAPPVIDPFPFLGASNGSDVSEGSGAKDSDDEEPCTVLLMDHVFGFSYGLPFIGNYTPPSCAFNRVIMNFTAVSAGRQFDRLALMYFGDTEVWRTSTAEPTPAPGIHWTYMKDMTEYLYFWKSPQTLIFDLGNLLDDKYTGSFNTTLTATFLVVDNDTYVGPPADVIIPISARKGASNEVSQFTLPADNATNTISFPQNVKRAVFSLSANGQATEEFWWANVLQSDVYAFNETAGSLPGLSPFREVQLLIDGQIAGVQWPFPVIFTGGVVPSLHRPIVGLQAFDLREHQVDITPWLPVLCDGTDHTFTIRVAGLNDDGTSSATLTETVNDSWYVTGKIFAWLDSDGSVTTGSAPVLEFSDPQITLSRDLTQNATGANETLTFSTAVQRTISVRANVSSQGTEGEAVWSQTLSYANAAVVAAYGFNQINNFTIGGTDVATAPNVSYRSIYTYPLYCNQTYSVSAQGNLTINAHLIEGLELQVEGDSVFPSGLEVFVQDDKDRNGNDDATLLPQFSGSYLRTSRDGTAWFFQTGDGLSSSGFGSTNQTFRFGGITTSTSTTGGDPEELELYMRDLAAVNGTVVRNLEQIGAAASPGESSSAPAAAAAAAGVGGKSEYAAAKVRMGSFGGGAAAEVRSRSSKSRSRSKGQENGLGTAAKGGLLMQAP